VEGVIFGWARKKKNSFLRSSCIIYDFESCIEVNVCGVAVIILMQYKNIVMKCIFLLVMTGHSHDFKSAVMLQNCMGLIKDEPDSGTEACVTTSDDGTEECSMEVEEAKIKVEESDIKVEEPKIKVEESDIKVHEADIKIESIDIKEENPEVKTFPPIKTEPEVSVWGLCVRQQQFMLPRPFTATKREYPKLHFYYPYVCTVVQPPWLSYFIPFYFS
jgi:hypothetical protein